MSNSLYHYCSLDTFLKIVESKEIWLTNIFCMNDSAEHYWLRDIAKAELDRRMAKDTSGRNDGRARSVSESLAEKLRSKEDNTDVYCFCVSELIDSFVHWREYADHGRGVAIGFAREFLRAAAKEYVRRGLRFEPVIYDCTEQKRIVNLILDSAMSEDVDTQESSAPAEWMEQLPSWFAESGIWSWAAQCKNPLFAKERELRLVYDASMDTARSLGQRKYRNSGDTPVPYYALPLEPLPQMGSLPVIYEVVLGPKCNQEFNESTVRNILSDHGYNVAFLHVWRSSGTYR